jgi:hypothetical protein
MLSFQHYGLGDPESQVPNRTSVCAGFPVDHCSKSEVSIVRILLLDQCTKPTVQAGLVDDT